MKKQTQFKQKKYNGGIITPKDPTKRNKYRKMMKGVGSKSKLAAIRFLKSEAAKFTIELAKRATKKQKSGDVRI